MKYIALLTLVVFLQPIPTQAALMLSVPQSANTGTVNPHYVHVVSSSIPKNSVAASTATTTQHSTLSREDIQRQIAQLLAQIEQIKAALLELQARKL